MVSISFKNCLSIEVEVAKKETLEEEFLKEIRLQYRIAYHLMKFLCLFPFFRRFFLTLVAVDRKAEGDSQILLTTALPVRCPSSGTL